MEVKLKNIGIVKDSSILVKGLTVVTGKNNSGKTTVGKTLYSVLDAVSNLQAKARNDRAKYIADCLDGIVNVMDTFRFFSFSYDRENIEGDVDNPLFGYPSLKALFWGNYRADASFDEIERFAHLVYDELRSIDVVQISKDKAMQRHLYRYVNKAQGQSSIEELIFQQCKKACDILEDLFAMLNKDPQLIDYARESINQTLRVEFSNQIQPVSISAESSFVEITNDGTPCFSFAIANNRVVNDGIPVFVSSPYKRVFLIDNPFLLDSGSMFRRFIKRYSPGETEGILNVGRIMPHEEKLKNVLRRKIQPTILEQTVINEALQKVKNQINEVLPGTFEFSSDGEYYVRNGNKLRISNLATGSKMFSIIKILIEQGQIDASTMLILDEPEAHLHPAWQNRFAEIIVLLVKELGVNILLTTHSSNFVLALDAFMRKYAIEEKTNFYQTNFLDCGMVEYTCTNDNIGAIYQDFLEYLSEVKMLRHECLRNAGDNT